MKARRRKPQQDASRLAQHFCTTRAVAVFVLCSLFLTGCFGSGLQSTIQPLTDSGRVIQSIYGVVTWICAGIFFVVIALLAWAVIRYRFRGEDKNDLPLQVHGNVAMEITWTIVPAIILIFIAFPTWEGIFRAEAPPTGVSRLDVDVYGRQWWWEFSYPKHNVKTANELVMPVGKPVVLNISSKDVIHAFWVPKLAGKVDALPGKRNVLWFTPEKEGLFYGQCAEFCGTSHANMRLRVRVLSEDAFSQWVKRQKQPQAPANASALAGEKLFVSKTCIACHAIEGNPVAAGVLGPDLTNLRERTSLASALIENTPDNLAAWIKNPQKIKPNALMGVAYQGKFGEIRYKPIEMTEKEARDLAAYLLSAPAAPQAAAKIRPAEPKAEASARTAAPSQAGGAFAAVQKGICWTCHIIPGVANAKGQIGPDLTGLASRAKIIGILAMNKQNLRKWLDDPQSIKPDTAMPPAAGLSSSEKELVIEYLLTLK